MKPGYISPVLRVASSLQDPVDSPAEQCARHACSRSSVQKGPLTCRPFLQNRQTLAEPIRPFHQEAVGRLSQVIVSGICGAGARLVGSPGWAPGPTVPPGESE